MKFKPTRKTGGVLFELGPKETEVPQLLEARPSPDWPELKLRSILVPVDFSPRSAKALTYGVALARRFEGELVLLHVIEPYPLVPQMEPIDGELAHEAKENLEELRRKVTPTVPVKVALRTGDPALEIVTAASEFSSDLIILSTQGRTGLAHVFFGSTAEKVARHAKCPTLIVREQERDFVHLDGLQSARHAMV